MSKTPSAAEARYREILASRRESETLRGLAERHDVNYQTLSWWGSRIRRRDAEAAATRAPRLLPVETLTRGPSQLAGLLGLGSTEEAPFEIALTSGRVVRVPQRFDRLGLRVLLEVLEA